MATKGKRKVYVVGVGMTKVRERVMVAFWPPPICVPSLRSLDGGMTLITRTWQRKQVEAVVMEGVALALFFLVQELKRCKMLDCLILT